MVCLSGDGPRGCVVRRQVCSRDGVPGHIGVPPPSVCTGAPGGTTTRDRGDGHGHGRPLGRGGRGRARPCAEGRYGTALSPAPGTGRRRPGRRGELEREPQLASGACGPARARLRSSGPAEKGVYQQRPWPLLGRGDENGAGDGNVAPPGGSQPPPQRVLAAGSPVAPTAGSGPGPLGIQATPAPAGAGERVFYLLKTSQACGPGAYLLPVRKNNRGARARARAGRDKRAIG